ncbi:MAG: DMT family protein [Bacteroidales bacterium]|nr:DMT family protein [Bacteroidales bacterium]
MQYFLPVLLLLIANIFMTLAWYGHLKLNQMGISSNWPLIAVILFSWGIALIEYIFQVPANKMGFIGNGGPFTLLQLKVIQEALSIFVFCVIANILFQGEKVAWNHLAAFGCLILAVVFVFWKN